jgi:hypothetical protein
MPIVEKSIWIDRSPQDVFDFHANHANRAAWHDHVTRSGMITPPPLGHGTRFHIRIKLNFRGFAKPFGWFILKLGLEKHFEEALREIKQEMEK